MEIGNLPMEGGYLSMGFGFTILRKKLASLNESTTTTAPVATPSQN
jgi:hypothetical protein